LQKTFLIEFCRKSILFRHIDKKVVVNPLSLTDKNDWESTEEEGRLPATDN
jgi:hypothetical protein